MKKTTMIIISLLAGLTAMAQEKTLIDLDGDYIIKGHAGIGIKLTQVNGYNAILTGPTGGSSINDKLTFGGSFYSTVNHIPGSDDSTEFDFAYGCGELGYILFPQKLIHIKTLISFGGGWMSLGKLSQDSLEPDSNQGFFLIEPSAEIILNLTCFMQLGIGYSYRLTNSSDKSNSFANLNGNTFGIFLRAGAF